MPHHSQQLAQSEPNRSPRIDPRIFLLALGMFALGTNVFIVAGILPIIAHDTGVSTGVVGQLVTAFSLTYALGAPILAVATGHWPPNRVLIAALGLFCLANVGSALAPTFPFLLFTCILTGCFAAIYAPMAYTIGISLAPAEKRGQALALVVIGLTVATALGAPLGTWVGEHFSWRLSYSLIAVLAGVAFLVLLIVGLPKSIAPSQLSLKERLAPITHPPLVLALLPSFVWNLGIYALYTYIALLLQQNLHITDITGLLVVFGLGIVIGNWSGGLLADRFGSNRPLVISLVALALVQAVLALFTTTWIASLLMLFIWGILGSVSFIPQQHRALSVAPEHANVILALNNSAYYLGIACGAVLGGLALRAVGVSGLSWVGAICILVGLGLLTLSIQLNRQRAKTRANISEKASLASE